MAAEASRAPQVREQTTAPDVQWGTCTVNSVTGALDDLTCRMERLRALFGSATDELHELATSGRLPEGVYPQLYSNVLILVTAGEKLREVDQLAAAILDKAYDDRRAVTA